MHTEPVLSIRHLKASYGSCMVLHDISIDLHPGATAVIGRNGMGKSTLCKAITGLLQPSSGDVLLRGRQIRRQAIHQIARSGIAFVPQGRRVFPSLTVDEHLTLAEQGRNAAWTVERVYHTFPRLAERRRNGGTQLSGGEQQMLAIGRALLCNPSLLVLDEPSEGLSPLVTQQIGALMKRLVDEEGMTLLLIEQNFRLAVSVASRLAVMVAGQIVLETGSAEFARDTALQQRYLGVGHA